MSGFDMGRFRRGLGAFAVGIGAVAIGVVSGGPQLALAGTQIDIHGPTGASQFGIRVLVLANGNFAVCDPSYNSPTATSVGLVRLYSGVNGQVISTLTGSHKDDSVCFGGLTEVGNSNFVVSSYAWNDSAGVVKSVGAATWVNGTTGLQGVVGPDNSIIGSATNDGVGFEVTPLSTGNYVVGSPFWSGNTGAVTWANGNAKTNEAVSSGNSLVAEQASELFGIIITPLTNGNFVVDAPGYDRPGFTDMGLVAWGDGSTNGPRTTGVISTATSKVVYGTHPSDSVGSGGILALTNGNFVVLSPNWHLGGTAGAGAATLANGATGSNIGVLSGNSLSGSNTNDHVGGGRSIVLTNGNYVVASPEWHNGASIADAGAATWRSGASAQINVGAAVVAGTSLVGGTANDAVSSGGILPLTHGNYVVLSPGWDSGATMDVGAATWADGSVGRSGTINSSNSLVGSVMSDGVGTTGVALTNNNDYVVGSPDWNDGVKLKAGAATWGNGDTGTLGPVTEANSLVGAAGSDRVGFTITPLTNGNYVAASPAATVARGVVTWARGDGPTSATATEANSLVGTHVNDQVGSGGVTALTNGNYVVGSPNWQRDGNNLVGAATFGDGTTGITGKVGITNSLVGVRASDVTGITVTPLSNGGYGVESRSFDNGPIPNADAITYGGPAGAIGEVSSANSVLGTVTNAFVTVSERLTSAGAMVVDREANNIVTLYKPDVTPPSFAATPPPITAVAPIGSASTAVTYSLPVATDDQGTPTVTCTPASGSLLPIGDTTVTCAARNAESLTATTSFVVTVIAAADYVPLSPVRLVDTRSGGTTVDGRFVAGGQIAGGSTFEVAVAGRGGVPSDAVAATLNVTVTEPAADGFLTVFPCGSPQPTASNLNYAAGGTIPNAVVTKIGADGHVCFFAQQTLHLVVDVNGAYPPTTSYVAINPARVIDTRLGGSTIDSRDAGGGAVQAGSVTVLQVTGRADVPSDATAVVLNVTVTEPAAAGFLTVFPCGSEPPTASNLNYVQGLTIPNLVISKIGAAPGSLGTVCIFSQRPTQLVADVLGYLPATTTYVAVVPARLLDTRKGAPTIDGQGAGGGVQPIATVTRVRVAGRGGVPANATTAALNVTVTEAEANGFVTVFPCGIDPPLASNLNFTVGQTIPNAVIAKIGTNGDVCIVNSQPTQLIADVTGYFP